MTSQKGIGIFTTVNLERGTFICLYAGELIDTADAKSRSEIRDRRGDAFYILTIKENDRLVGHVDPTIHGNVGRFLNHSCSPNSVMQLVRWGTTSIPRPAVFVSRSCQNVFDAILMLPPSRPYEI